MISKEFFISMTLFLIVLNVCKSHQTYESENATLPIFKHPNRMYGLVVKPVGNMVRYKCAAEGNPNPNITWYKNGITPIIRPLGRAQIKNWALTLEDLETQDNGNYTCNVCNIKGCINSTFRLEVVERVHSKPIFTETPKHQTKMAGEDVEFKCNVLSDLHVYTLWTFNSPNFSTNQSVLKTGENNEILKIKNVTTKDKGFYTCYAFNSLGRVSATAYLNVIQIPPNVDDGYPGNKTGLVNSTVVFKCPGTQTTFRPFRKVWHTFSSSEFDEETFNYTSISTVDKSKLFEGGTILILENISYEDEGWYICVVFGDDEVAYGKGYLSVKECS